jgi:MFS family permease
MLAGPEKRSMNNGYLKGMGANIILLGIVSFLNDVSSEMIMPILPMFITSLGGGGIIIGLISGLMESVSSILKVFCGYWSDRSGKRKTFVFSGYLTSAIFKLLLSLSTIWQHIFIFTSLERVGKGLRTSPRDAIIADSMPEERGKGFGIHRAFDSSGAILGSLIAFFLVLRSGWQFTTIIFIAAVLAFLSLIPLQFVKEIRRSNRNASLRLSMKNLPSSLKLYLIVVGVFTLANFSYMFFILRAREVFPIPFGILSDKIGRRRALIIGYLAFSLAVLGFAFFKSLAAFFILFPLYGISNAAVDGNQRAFASDLSTQELRATVLGIFHTTVGVIAILSGLIAGLLWEKISPEATFIYGSILSVCAVLIFIVTGRFFEEPAA